VWETAETFARLKRPLHFSEVTVLSDDPRADHSRAWPSTPEGEQRQAEYVEKFYTLLFSHPSVDGIGWWNFVDGDWDRNPVRLLQERDLHGPAPADFRVRLKGCAGHSAKEPPALLRFEPPPVRIDSRHLLGLHYFQAPQEHRKLTAEMLRQAVLSELPDSGR